MVRLTQERTGTEDDRRAADTAITLKAAGLTLLGVIVSVGVTVAFGIPGPWWLQIAGGVGVTVGLAALVKLTSGSRSGPLARIANWMIGAPERND